MNDIWILNQHCSPWQDHTVIGLANADFNLQWLSVMYENRRGAVRNQENSALILHAWVALACLARGNPLSFPPYCGICLTCLCEILNEMKIHLKVFFKILDTPR